MTKRFSRKRQSILHCLQATTTHPSAEWIYEQLKPQYPDLSLGTVYRNLGELLEEGAIISVGVVQARERFDARVAPHTHAVCLACGKVMDLDAVVLPASVLEAAGQTAGFHITATRLQFEGFCAACAAKENAGVAERDAHVPCDRDSSIPPCV